MKTAGDSKCGAGRVTWLGSTVPQVHTVVAAGVYIALILLLAGTAGAEAQQPGPSVEAGVEVRFCDLPRIEGHAGKFMLRQMLAVQNLKPG
jgi:hypothetical protein